MRSATPTLDQLQRQFADTDALRQPTAARTPHQHDRTTLPALAQAIWQAGPTDQALADYQQACREVSQQLASSGQRQRPLCVVVPVADRPRHLAALIESLRQQQQLFGYRGAVSLLLVDDSGDSAAIAAQRELLAAQRAAGLTIHHFDAAAQQQLLQQLQVATDRRFDALLDTPSRRASPYKGASLSRNLALLQRQRLPLPADTLLLFIDSDQLFRIRFQRANRVCERPALNYFGILNRLFSDSNTAVATGKVVGDPPVSPAVMSANLLRDLDATLAQLATHTATAPCQFHHPVSSADDAAYHDFAALFGFAGEPAPFRYRCPLTEPHDHHACLQQLAQQLPRFFDGEHPTRGSLYQPSDAIATRQPARTVYTGNYCSVASDHFIPFAPLRLRMAGPTLGRILQAELGERFSAINLPLLHTRSAHGSEFRAGVSHHHDGAVDLSGECERQFYGDVMLFSCRDLIAAGFLQQPIDRAAIEPQVARVAADLQQRYAEQRVMIDTSLAHCRHRFDDPAQWWQQQPTLAATRDRFATLFDNIAANFGSGGHCHRYLADSRHAVARLDAIVQALAGYRQQQQQWRQLLSAAAALPPVAM